MKERKRTYKEMTKAFMDTRSDSDFKVLYNRLKPGLSHFIFGIIKDRDVTEDILNNTMIKLFTKIDQYNPEYQITTWVYRIARNECFAHINKRKMTSSLSLFEDKGFNAHADGEGSITMSPTNNAYLESHIDKTDEEFHEEEKKILDQYDRVIEAIYNLKDLYRDIMVDRFINKMKYSYEGKYPSHNMC